MISADQSDQFGTLSVFAVSLQEKHVGVDAPLLHVFLHPLNEETPLDVSRSRTSVSLRASAYHFGVSSIDDDARAVRRGGHLAGGARRGGGA